VTRSRRHKEELEHANQGLEDAYAELQSTNGELQTINDEVGIRTTELDHLQPPARQRQDPPRVIVVVEPQPDTQAARD
jgi:hypothetical protein